MFDPLSTEQTRALGEALQAIVERLDPDRSLRDGASADPGG
jgi:hypothetical protein